MSEEIILNPFDLRRIKNKGFVEYGRYIITTKTQWDKHKENKEVKS